jgi:hypothetical protein
MVPNESYYHQRDTNASRRSLGIALLVIGVIWLLNSAIPNKPPIFGSLGNDTVFDETYRASRLVLNSGNANVEVGRWNGEGIHVRAVQEGGNGDDYTIVIDENSDTLTVGHSSTPCMFFCNRTLTYYIELPAETPALIQSTSGDIEASQIAAGLDIKTTSGDISLNEIVGPLSIVTTSGDISLEDSQVLGANIATTSGEVYLDGVTNTVIVQTISGDVVIDGGNQARLELSSTSGKISYRGTLASGSHLLNSISGEVSLNLPESSSFVIDANSISGEISSDFPINTTISSENTLQGQVGSGDALLQINTTSGDINIEQE